MDPTGIQGRPCKPHAHACRRKCRCSRPDSTAQSACSLFDGRVKSQHSRCECRSLQRRHRRGGRTPAGSVRPCGRVPVPAGWHIRMVGSHKPCSHPAGAPQQPRRQWRRQRPSDGFEHPAAGSRSSDSSDSSSGSSAGPEPWLQAQREIQAQQAAGLTQPWPLDSTRVRRASCDVCWLLVVVTRNCSLTAWIKLHSSFFLVPQSLDCPKKHSAHRPTWQPLTSLPPPGRSVWWRRPCLLQ